MLSGPLLYNYTSIFVVNGMHGHLALAWPYLHALELGQVIPTQDKARDMARAMATARLRAGARR